MKNKTILFALFYLIVICKLNAQEDNQETVLKFKLAQDEYENKNYSKSLEYLGQISDDKAKARVSYLSAKCYENILSTSKSNTIPDSIYTSLIKNINNYIDVGKDEDKKTELMKSKVQIENTEGYKLIQEFRNITTNEDAIKIIKKTIGDFPFKRSHGPPVYSINFIDNCSVEIILADKTINNGIGEVDFITLSLLDAFIGKERVDIKVSNNKSYLWLQKNYINQAELEKFEGDIVKYKNDISKNRKSKVDFENMNYAYTSIFLGHLCDNTAIPKIEKAFQVLIKNCSNKKSE